MPNSSPESDLIDGLKVIISKQLGIALSNKKLGTLLLSANRFNNIIRDNAVLRKNSLDKIELKLRQLLNESNLKQALMVLEAYRERRSKIYSQKVAQSYEYKFAREIQKIFFEKNHKLLSFSRLGEIFGYKALFNDAINKNFRIRKFTLEKIMEKAEQFLIEPHLSKLKQAIEDYSLSVGYHLKKVTKNKPEIVLLNILKKSYSNEFQKQFSNNGLGQKFGSRLLFNDMLRKGTEYVRLTIERMEHVCENELSGANKLKALYALERYRDLNSINSQANPEMILINKLRTLFSSNDLLSMSELSRIIIPHNRNLIHNAIKDKSVFKNTTIKLMEKAVQNKLPMKKQKEAMKYINRYKNLKRFERKIEIFNAESKLNEEICRCIFEELFSPYKFPTVSIFTFEWLMGPNGGSMHVDGYSTEINLGFEYNGIQHYEVDGFYNKTKKDLEKQQQLDKHKTELFSEHGKRVIVIPYKIKPKEKVAFILKNCKDFGISPAITNIDIEKIKKTARQRIKNRNKNNKASLQKNNQIKETRNLEVREPHFQSVPFPHRKGPPATSKPFPHIDPRENVQEIDFNEDYLWTSPQMREQKQI